jgi:hypothetical protein
MAGILELALEQNYIDSIFCQLGAGVGHAG